ncbi:Gibberellin 3-beta-dioxygenase 1 [Camellia lanceoleosa]|uniref:Gibberellin 3-beta-dioxygenase 1 n=1 Tax=Camellia lanceoleosa TaxID=1840588 RepID=A0ACC0FMW9_9ERIC|nr:Gibberellin 3-beta-dioxygenase 1 [Camellia lanceoleosa]
MNSISESFKSHPLHLNHIIPLDFNSLPKVPDSHTWTLPKSNHNSLSTESIPIIDLLGDSKNTNELIQQACEKWGVFQIINHGVPITLLYQIEHQTRRLFALPAKQKLRAMRSPDGLTGYGVARIAPFFPKLMWSEGFSAVGSPEEHARQLWPHDYTTFCYVMEDYQKEMQALSEIIMGLMVTSLGLTHEDVKWFKPNNRSKPPQALLQLNSYPVCPDPSQAMGLAPHTDSSLLTLLYQSNTSGLQVLHGNSGWVTVPPLADALVVNVGDLMHILSNGRFKTTLHRAVVNKAEHRISVAYFFGPSRDAKISPLIKLTDHNHLPLYRPVTWKEYLGVKATYFNKALDLIRLDTFSTI